MRESDLVVAVDVSQVREFSVYTLAVFVQSNWSGKDFRATLSLLHWLDPHLFHRAHWSHYSPRCRWHFHEAGGLGSIRFDY